MAISRRDPYGELTTLRDAMSRLFEDSVVRPSSAMSAHTAALGGATFSAYNPAGVSSNWCDARFVAKLSFDLTLANLK